MSLLFTMLSMFSIAFLLKSKHLLISCLQSPSAVILEPKKTKSVTASTFSHSICHEVGVVMGFPGDNSDKEPASQCRRHKRWGFDPSVWKIPWRRACQPTPVFLPGESPWTEEPGGLRSIGLQRVGHNWSDVARRRAVILHTQYYTLGFTTIYCHSLEVLYTHFLLHNISPRCLWFSKFSCLIF